MQKKIIIFTLKGERVVTVVWICGFGCCTEVDLTETCYLFTIILKT